MWRASAREPAVSDRRRDARENGGGTGEDVDLTVNRPKGGCHDPSRPALAHSPDLDARARHRTRRGLLSRRARTAFPFRGPAAPGILRLRWRTADAVHSRAGLRPPWLGSLLRSGRHPTHARLTHIARHSVPDGTAQDRHPGGSRSVARRLRRYRGEHAGADVRAATPPLAQAGHDAPFRRSGRAERRARLTRTGRGPNL